MSCVVHAIQSNLIHQNGYDEQRDVNNKLIGSSRFLRIHRASQIHRIYWLRSVYSLFVYASRAYATLNICRAAQIKNP